MNLAIFRSTLCREEQLDAAAADDNNSSAQSWVSRGTFSPPFVAAGEPIVFAEGCRRAAPTQTFDTRKYTETIGGLRRRALVLPRL